MKKLTLYQVDAFTNRLFAGNPAALCILDSWINDDLMQSIAAENNLAETAFIVAAGQDFEIRWFTPTVEVDLCGHATLATAYVLFNCLGYEHPEVLFHSPRSGQLKVFRKNENLFLDFPTDTLNKCPEDKDQMAECIGIFPQEVYKGRSDYMAVVDKATDVQHLNPNLAAISKLQARGLIVTARGEDVDFVSRFFGPQSGINEDPVTGSAHTSLTPLWHEKLGKKVMTAKQLSQRGGELICEYNGSRTFIGGRARLYLVGQIEVV